MSNEIAVREQIGSMIAKGAGQSFCSVNMAGDRDKAKLVYNAMNNPEFRVADFINQEINVTDVLIETTEIGNEETGEISVVPRVVLIDDEGKAYQSVSVGMFNAVKNLIFIYGEPTWDPALTIKIKQRAVKNGSMLTADIV